jgi:hypothetical protein
VYIKLFLGKSDRSVCFSDIQQSPRRSSGIMISPKTLSLTALLLGATANAQVYETGGRSEDAFSWIQPEDTVILDQYNSSEPVYPSRESEITPTDECCRTN